MAFTAARIEIQITERLWGGQIRYSQLHSWNLFNSVPPERSFYLARPHRAFCSAGVAKTTILLPFGAMKGEAQNIDFRNL